MMYGGWCMIDDDSVDEADEDDGEADDDYV